MAIASSSTTRAMVHPQRATPRDSRAHESPPDEMPTWEAFFAWRAAHPDVVRHTKTNERQKKASSTNAFRPRDVQAIIRELGMDIHSSRMTCGEKVCKGLVVSGRAVRNEHGEWRVVAKFHHNQKCRSEHRRLRHSREMRRLLREVAMRNKRREASVSDDPDEIGESSPDGAVLDFNADSYVDVDDGIDSGFDALSDVDSENIRLIEKAFPDPHDGMSMRRMVAAIIFTIALAMLVTTKCIVPAPLSTKQLARFSHFTGN